MHHDEHSGATPPEPIHVAVLEALRSRTPVALCTVVETGGSAPQTVGARMAVTAERFVGTVGGGRVEAVVLAEARARLAEGGHSGLLRYDLLEVGMACGGGMTVFVDVMRPTERLVVFGGGHVGRAIAPVAAAAGFHVVVVDDRPEWADAAAFPAGVEVVCAPFADYLERFEGGPGDYAVIVTRGHDHDEGVLRRLVGRPLGYLGMMGSRRKVLQLFAHLRDEGVADEALARVDAPIGLPIGAVTPGELAVSIVARLVATRRKADVGTLGRGRE